MRTPEVDEALRTGEPGTPLMFKVEPNVVYLLAKARLGLRMRVLPPRPSWISAGVDPIRSAFVQVRSFGLHASPGKEGVAVLQFFWTIELENDGWIRHDAGFTEASPDVVPGSPLLTVFLPQSSWITRKGKTVQDSGTLVVDLLRVRPT